MTPCRLRSWPPAGWTTPPSATCTASAACSAPGARCTPGRAAWRAAALTRRGKRACCSWTSLRATCRRGLCPCPGGGMRSCAWTSRTRTPCRRRLRRCRRGLRAIFTASCSRARPTARRTPPRCARRSRGGCSRCSCAMRRARAGISGRGRERARCAGSFWPN